MNLSDINRAHFAYIHEDDGQRWVRVIEGEIEWDEPLAGWERLLDLINGGMYLRQGNRKYQERDP